MTTADELLALFFTGAISDLLATEFKGKIGYRNPGFLDSDVLITFPSEAETPSAEAIATVITTFLSNKGLIVKDTTKGKDNFQAQVLSPQTDQIWVLVNIATRYPQQTRANLHMYCQRD